MIGTSFRKLLQWCVDSEPTPRCPVNIDKNNLDRPADVFSLTGLIDPLPSIKVVDVGAMWVGEVGVPYWPLLQAGLATVVGFEPIEEEYCKLRALLKAPHLCFPFLIGNGEEGTLRVCQSTMTSSLYEPNRPLLGLFEELEGIVRVVDELHLPTKKLDDVSEAKNAEFLKIDVQGAELDVLSGAIHLLEEVLVIHTEVEFVPLYYSQPLFADVDTFLRKSGFALFALEKIHSRAYRPFNEDEAQFIRSKQALWTDAVYVRSLFDLECLGTDRLIRLAVIIHYVYGAFDLCHRILTHVDLTCSTQLAERYRSRARSRFTAIKTGQ